MRTRDKVVVVLIVASLILGGLIFVAFQDNEVEANYSRWLFTTNLQHLFSSPAKFLSDELPSGTVFYGGLTLFAVVMTVVFLKMTRDGEIQALRRRLIDLRSEKHQTESLLQEEVWKGKHERQSKDSAMRDLETSIDKIETLLGELNEKEQELKARDVQLVSLKTSALGDSDSTPARPSSERLLREEINKKNEILQTKDSAIRELEQRLSAKTRLWESQLREKDGLLNGRNSELESLRVEISDLNGQLNDLASAKKRAEDLLQEELRKKKEVLEANDVAVRSEERRLTERIRALENHVGEKDKLLRTRDTELSGFRRQLDEFESAKEQMQSRLQEELGKSEQDRRAKDQVIKDLEQRLSANLQALKNEVGEKDLLLQTRAAELKSLQSEVKSISLRLSEMAAAKVRAEENLQEELKKERQQHENARIAYQELEERTGKEIKLLAAQRAEQEESFTRRAGEIQKLKQEVDAVALRLRESSVAKEQTEKALRDQLNKEKAQRESKEAAGRELEQRYGTEIQALKSQLGEKEESLRSRGDEIKSLKTQVASLAEQLTKVGSAKERAASLLQQKLKAEKQGLQANDSAVRELEASFTAKIGALEQQLAAKQDLVGNRDTEVAALKSELASLNQKMANLAAAHKQAENLFEDAVRERTELLQSKDAAVEKLEADLSGRIREMESRLRENDDLLNRRESELSELKNQLAEVATAKEQTARSLGENLREKTHCSTRKTPLSMLLRSVSARASTRLRASSARNRIFSKRGSRNLEGSWPKPTRCPATWPSLGPQKTRRYVRSKKT